MQTTTKRVLGRAKTYITEDNNSPPPPTYRDRLKSISHTQLSLARQSLPACSRHALHSLCWRMRYLLWCKSSSRTEFPNIIAKWNDAFITNTRRVGIRFLNLNCNSITYSHLNVKSNIKPYECKIIIKFVLKRNVQYQNTSPVFHLVENLPVWLPRYVSFKSVILSDKRGSQFYL